MSIVSFYCVICGKGLSAPAAYAGSVYECSGCSHSVPVPGFPGRGGFTSLPSYAAGILTMDLTFSCEGCEARLVVDARWEGHEVDCPRCKTAVVVPRWSGAEASPATAAPAASGVRLTAEEIGFLSGEFNQALAS
jgi:hypothetical protein